MKYLDDEEKKLMRSLEKDEWVFDFNQSISHFYAHSQITEGEISFSKKKHT